MSRRGGYLNFRGPCPILAATVILAIYLPLSYFDDDDDVDDLPLSYLYYLYYNLFYYSVLLYITGIFITCIVAITFIICLLIICMCIYLAATIILPFLALHAFQPSSEGSVMLLPVCSAA